MDKGNTNINRPNIFVANEVLFLPKLDTIQQAGATDPRADGSSTASFLLAEGSSLSVFIERRSFRQHGHAGWRHGRVQHPELTGGNRLHRQPAAAARSRYRLQHGKTWGPDPEPSHFTLNGYAIGTFPSNLATARLLLWRSKHQRGCPTGQELDDQGEVPDQVQHGLLQPLQPSPTSTAPTWKGRPSTPTAAVYCGGATATSGAALQPNQ